MDELVRGYVEGQVSRRVFIRRAVAAGLTATGAIAYADLLAAMPASAATTSVSVGDYFFYMPTTRVRLGDYVQFSIDEGAHAVMPRQDGVNPGLFHTYDPGPYESGQFGTYSGFSQIFYAAGTWEYQCPDPKHGSGQPMLGTIEVPPLVSPKRAPVGSRVKIEWAVSPAGFGVFDVDVKEPGGSWKRWKNGVDPDVLSGRFKLQIKGKHRVRARFRNPAQPAAIDWSPEVVFSAR